MRTIHKCILTSGPVHQLVVRCKQGWKSSESLVSPGQGTEFRVPRWGVGARKATLVVEYGSGRRVVLCFGVVAANTSDTVDVFDDEVGFAVCGLRFAVCGLRFAVCC
jgi:hypothetical protein